MSSEIFTKFTMKRLLFCQCFHLTKQNFPRHLHQENLHMNFPSLIRTLDLSDCEVIQWRMALDTGGGRAAHISIFGLTEHKNNRFQNKLMVQNTYMENNTWVRGNTRFISSVEHHTRNKSGISKHPCIFLFII